MELSGVKMHSDFGLLPDDWRVEEIGKISTVGRGRVISHKEIARSLNPQYPVYSSQTSNRGVMGYLDNYDFDGRYITWTTDGAKAGTVFERKGKFNCTNVCGTILLHADSPAFVSRILGLIAPRHVSRHLGNPKLMNDVMKRVAIPLPPTRAEQEAIADALSNADAYVESLEQLIVKKRLVKQGAMQELLTGKRRLSGFEGEPGTNKTVIGLAPADWSVISFGDLFHFSGGYSASREDLSFDGHYYLHYGDIHTSDATFIDLDAPRFHIPKLNVHIKMVSANSLLSDGDVVFVDASEDEDGASKHVVVVNNRRLPFISGLHTIVAKQKSSLLDHMFLRYCFKSPAVKSQFRFYAVGTKVLGVSKGNIVNIMMAVPPLKEQAAIGIMLSDMDAEIDQLQATLDKARDIKQGMMQNLLTGRIRLV